MGWEGHVPSWPQDPVEVTNLVWRHGFVTQLQFPFPTTFVGPNPRGIALIHPTDATQPPVPTAEPSPIGPDQLSFRSKKITMQLHRLSSKVGPSLRAKAAHFPLVRMPPSVRCLATEEEKTEVATTEQVAEVLVAKAGYKNVGPPPVPFSIADGQMMDVITGSLPALTRLGSGALVVGYKTAMVEEGSSEAGQYSVFRNGGKKLVESSDLIPSFNRPVKTLELYEFEACPFCAKVREAMCMLDLDVLMYPCPPNGTEYRPKAIELGGKKQFPFLVDPNTDKMIYESDDIVNYLFTTYGNGAVPWQLKTGVAGALLGSIGSIARAGKGSKPVPSKKPAEPLIFWGYEASPFVRVGHFQVPCLEDPNTGSYLFESAAIMGRAARYNCTFTAVQLATTALAAVHALQLYLHSRAARYDCTLSAVQLATTALAAVHALELYLHSRAARYDCALTAVHTHKLQLSLHSRARGTSVPWQPCIKAEFYLRPRLAQRLQQVLAFPQDWGTSQSDPGSTQRLQQVLAFPQDWGTSQSDPGSTQRLQQVLAFPQDWGTSQSDPGSTQRLQQVLAFPQDWGTSQSDPGSTQRLQQVLAFPQDWGTSQSDPGSTQRLQQVLAFPQTWGTSQSDPGSAVGLPASN
eukprot:gene11853-14958_t